MILQSQFDSAYYLAQNPDVATAVARGDLNSAYQHYSQFGIAEGRPGARMLPGTGNVVSDADFVTALYQHYYNRTPDAAGLAFWVNEITSNRKTRAGVEQAFASSPDIVQAAQSGGGGGGSAGGGTVVNTGGGTGAAVPVVPAAPGMSPLLLIGLGIGVYFLLKD